MSTSLSTLATASTPISGVTAVPMDWISFMTFSVGVNLLNGCNWTSLTYDVMEMDGDCLVLVYIETTYKRAMTFCQDVGGHLADIDYNTQYTVENFTAENPNKRRDFWIGLIYSAALEEWVWLNGAKLTYTDPFRSDDVGDCVVSQTDNKMWKKTNCSNEKTFICKTPIHDQKEKKCPEVTEFNTTRTTSTDNMTTVASSTTIMSTTQEGLPVTTDGTQFERNKADHNKESEEQYMILLVISAMLVISLLINLVLLIRYLILCTRRSRRHKQKQSKFHVAMAMSSMNSPLVQADPVSTQSCALKKSAPRAIPQNTKDDIDIDLYSELDGSPAAPELSKIASNKKPKSSTFPRKKIDKKRKDSERSEIAIFFNDIYNQDVVNEENANVGEGLPKKSSIGSVTCSPKQFSLSDKDSIYDVPISPTSGAYSYKRSIDRTANVSMTGIHSPRSGTQSPEIYFNDPVSDTIPEEDGDDSLLQFGMNGKLEINEEEFAEEEGPYANTEF